MHRSSCRTLTASSSFTSLFHPLTQSVLIFLAAKTTTFQLRSHRDQSPTEGLLHPGKDLLVGKNRQPHLSSGCNATVMQQLKMTQKGQLGCHQPSSKRTSEPLGAGLLVQHKHFIHAPSSDASIVFAFAVIVSTIHIVGFAVCAELGLVFLCKFTFYLFRKSLELVHWSDGNI